MNQVVELKEEQSSVGAPCPVVLSDEHDLFVAYYMQEQSKDFELEAVGLVKFTGFHSYKFGAPNDEAFHGHPLSENGLEPYGTFKIQNSTWVQELCIQNSVHPYHSDDIFRDLIHFVWSFHDTTLEVVAKSYEFSLHQGTPSSVLASYLSSIE
ncbi:hypothetical protein [Shewanella gelidii]|uniref:Uncharacterized protein n=1 Tax=Shewanella gelidii TaxID=1642821 RepID=A0A917NDB5_9GAMM|nr:hypothetical protein [Shewanella gelidii]MCL1099700.1 hypothetical protein [Shewanella gelidii]GGI89283.1 hypothetical protein GCM10009332_28360 [Shewanella gelidii]